MKVYEIFEKAKAILWDGVSKNGCPHNREEFICHAITRVGDDDYFLMTKCREVIRTRMQGCLTLETWLQTNGHATRRQCTPKRMQAYRRDWLTELAREFKEKNK